MDCGMSMIKYLLFIFNLIFAISGVAIIIAGAVVLADVDDYHHFMEGRILAPPVVLIIAGVIVFVIAFLGCYGAIKENYTLLMTFAVALLVIFIIELAVGIAAAVLKSNFGDVLKESLKNSIGNYTEADKIAWDNVQTQLQCCGYEGEKDWANVIEPPGTLPPSCCEKPLLNDLCIPNSPNVWKKGCYEVLEMKVRSGSKVMIGVGIGIAFIEIVGVVLACVLALSIKKESEK